MRIVPDFIIIGAAKSGTTSLYKHLMRHPEIFLSDPKEPCFFDDSVGWPKGVDWYNSLFQGAKNNHLCGEASTNYTRWPQVKGVPERIKDHNPEVKLIYIVRNPVDRAYSHYLHRWKKETHPNEPFSLNFFEYSKIDSMCIDSSKYDTQLNQYLISFEKNQIMVVVFEELLCNPDMVLDKIYDFLGLDIRKAIAEPLIAENTSDQFAYDMLRKRVTSRVKRLPGVKVVAKIIPKRLKDRLYNGFLLKSSYARREEERFSAPRLNAQERDFLLDFFKEENEKLAKSWGVDISHWQ